MFDFEKLLVYSKAKACNLIIYKFILNCKLDISIKNQLRRCSLSIVLNIAEGSGRNPKADKRNFFVILTTEMYQSFYSSAEELSKMLFAMIQKLEKPMELR
jgi:hypothetical protein